MRAGEEQQSASAGGEEWTVVTRRRGKGKRKEEPKAPTPAKNSSPTSVFDFPAASSFNFVSPPSSSTTFHFGVPSTSRCRTQHVSTQTSTSDCEEPAALLCPISSNLFRDPVFVSTSGNTYEREMIEAFWARSNGEKRDPYSNTVLHTAARRTSGWR